MDQLIIKSKSKTKARNKINMHQRLPSHDFSDYILSMNKNNNICCPLKAKNNVKSKFYIANTNMALPKLEDIKGSVSRKSVSSSRLIAFNQNVSLLTSKNNSKQNLPSISLPKLNKNNSIVIERKKRKSMSYFKSNSLKITPSKNKRLYLDTNMIKEYHGTSMAGTDDFGQTKINQDSYLILTKLNNFINYNVFAVFDGHGLQGHLVSQFLVKYFTGFFKNNPQLTKCKDELQVFNLFLCNDYKILRDAVKNCEEELMKEEDIDSKYSGSTLCMVIQIYKKIICMNVGDSRAILSVSEILRDDIKHLSEDHKPILKHEQERIKKCGGYIEKCIYEDGIADGPFRVWNSPTLEAPGLALSRSIGDTDAINLGVISEPDFILKSMKKDMNFIVIASDGIWEFLDNKKVGEIVKNFYLNGTAKEAAEEIVKKSREIWEENGKEVDDITAIIIFL